MSIDLSPLLTTPRPLVEPGQYLPTPSLKRPELPLVEQVMRDLSLGRDGDYLGRVAVQHLEGGGKRVRARLALAAMEGLGEDPRRAIPLAAAAELLHNATLLDCPDATRWQIGRAITHRAMACVRGQALELELARTGQYDWTSWSQAALGKTGELLALPIQGAALLAGWSRDEAAALGDVFRGLGLLYQLQDDVLDLYGDKGRGRAGNDLREGKPSALVVEHLRLAPEDRPWLLGVLSAPRDQTPEAEVARASARFVESGALAAVEERMDRLSAEIQGSPLLLTAPPLHGIAGGLVMMLRGGR
jgi:geranylgeranyl pyrophosphate synthase